MILVCVFMSVCIYWITHNPAIRLCHPSHPMPLAYVCVCARARVCVIIKLHITAQSGPVILVMLRHSH